MFKRYITIMFLTALALASCQNNTIEEVFQKSATEKQDERLQEFNTELKKNELWLASMYTETGKKTLFMKVQFLDNHRAKIGKVKEPIEAAKECSYTLNYTQQENLVFDSHNYMAEAVDAGIKGDFRWSVQENTDNYILFKSRAEGSEGKSFLRFEKYSEELLLSKVTLMNDPNISPFRNIEMDGSNVRYGFAYNNVLNKATITKWEAENEREVTEKVDVDINDKEMIFSEPIVIEGNKFTKFTLGEDNVFTSEEGGKKAYIRYSGYSPVMQTGADFVYGKNSPNDYFSFDTSDYTKFSPAYINELLKLMKIGEQIRYQLFVNDPKYGAYIKIVSSTGSTYVFFKIEDKELGRKVLIPTKPIPEKYQSLLAPFFDPKGVYFIDKGDYITGNGKRYPNNSVDLISVANPAYRTYAYAGNYR
ncbi:DUF4302 domain-containing protein [Prolixibacteraceae bacterium]|nr:DUF4302 domain-containing protein [Prolixibacteraceae bacterium]